MTTNQRRVLCLLLLLALPTGCWDRAEIEDQMYVIAMGLDQAAGGGIALTALVAVPPVLPIGILGAPVPPPEPRLGAQRLTASGRTVTQAIYTLNGGLTRRLDLRHLRAVVVGESLARAGLEPVLAELLRAPLARGSALLAQARGSAYDVITAFEPVAEINPGRMAEGLILQAKSLHLAPPVRMHHFTLRLAVPGADPFLPVAAVNPGVTWRPRRPLPVPETSALPGQLPRDGGNPVEYAGTAVFREDRLAGYLTVDETQMLLALRGEMGKAYISFPDPSAPDQAITMRFHQENLPKYRATLRGGQHRVEARLLFEGEVLAIPSGTDYTQPAERHRLAQAAVAYSQQTIRGLLDKVQQWGADPVAFGQLFRGRFPTWRDWWEYDWRRQVAGLQVDVQVDMRIRRYGLLLGGGQRERES